MIQIEDIENLSDPKEIMSLDDLRKKARLLENKIDNKLIEFSKLATSFGTGAKKMPTEQELLLSADDRYDSLLSELQDSLNVLSDINEKMSTGHSNSYETMHTIQRHKDILQDYSREFERTKHAIKSKMEREQLLSGGQNGEVITGLSRRDLYLKEDDHLVNSEKMIDDQINIALETRDHLKTQRETFKLIQTKVNDLSNRFPIINSLMTKINLRRRRDAIIIGVVVSLCILFVIWWFH